MKKSLVFIVFTTVVLATFLFAQKSTITIAARWERVNQLAEKQLPESALKEVEAILEQAQKEENSPEVIKAMVYKMRFTLEKNPDESPALIKDFEVFTERSTNPAERALLHSMTADLYAQYYQKDQWNINRRTEVVGTVPDDIKEWTKNIYFDKITKHLAASLENPTVLQKTDALKFAAMLEKGADSKELQPTLFDFLGNRRIQILEQLSQATSVKNPLTNPELFGDVASFSTLPLDSAFISSVENQVIKTYQQLLLFRLKAHNTEALINLDLERLEYFHSNTKNENADSLYLMSLNRLIKQYSNNELVVEVLAEKAGYYYGKVDDEDEGDIENSTISPDFKRKAYDICTYGIRLFPKYKRIGLLINIRKEITKKNINIDYSEAVKLGSNLKVKINSCNISSLQLLVYRINATAMEFHNFKENGLRSTYPNRTLVETREIAIKPNASFGSVITEIAIKPKDYGIYDFCLEMKDNKKTSQRVKGIFTVTDLAFMKRINNSEKVSLYALDRQTGEPQNDVKIKVYNQKWTGNGYKLNLINSFNSNQNGLCEYPKSVDFTNDFYYFERGKDVYFTSSANAYFNSNIKYENDGCRINLFTDRAIYRPGQTVYFKGIAYYSNSKKQEVLPKTEFEVTLYDTNSKKVSLKKVITNGFGSFTGEFVLPEGGLNGTYAIQAGTGYMAFLVEEYKRPTFEVKIDKPKSEIQFGENVFIKGTVKAYAGYNIGDANVKYRVLRRVHHFCWWFNEPEEEIANGITKSNKDGVFEVNFVPSKSKSKFSIFSDRAYTYTIYADVTDPKGETQQGEQAISVGDKSLFIIADVSEKINKKERFSQEITTETINDEKINSIVKYSVHRLDDTNVYNENLNENKDLKEAELVMSGSFNTKDKKLDLDFKRLNSGRYKFIFTTLDAHGKVVKLEKVFILYSPDDKRPPVKSYVWLLKLKTECVVGETAQIQFGTSTKKTMVLYEVMQGNAILESRWISFSDETKTFEIPFKESYGVGITVMFTFMKEERFFTESVQITKKIEERKLTPTLSVFRDKLQPGEKSEWTVTINESIGNKNEAELLIGMYDASLDAIRPHSWNFNPTYRESVLYSPLWTANSFETGSDNTTFSVKYNKIYDYQFNALNWFGLEMGGYYRHGRAGTRMSVKFSAPVIKKDEEVISIADVKGNDETGKDIADVKTVITGSVVARKLEKTTNGVQAPIQIRTNFNETAFFYPQLRTDAQGNVKFSFTAPESLTRWNVKMLAHTTDLYFGQATEQVVTHKDLMVQMNLPRFVRRSDKLVLSANVVNLTDKDLKANVTFELIDPATDKIICTKSIAPLSLGRGVGGEVVSWELTEFLPYELVTCKVVARAGNFSDGEQKYLPVLPDKVLVTESMPLTVRGNQTRTFNFESLLKNGSSVDTKNLSVEFSSNPAWYAVQALPTISTPENDNALDYFTAYYANSLAAFIANSNPKIAATFDRWKKAGGSREALLSNLQKNTELKNMLLEETPWVMAAKDETEQKRQIALLFDLNMQKNQTQQYLDKLISLQLPSGAFSWFKGMGESRYITQEILLNLARLNKLVGGNVLTAYRLPLAAALNYLDLEIARDFDNLKKYNKNYDKEMSIGNMQLFYLHMRSEYPEIPVHVSAQAAVKFYTAQSEKYWTTFTLYGKAMMAVVAQRNGKIQVANDILKSLRENALKTDEFGMYWAKNTSGYYWNERPIAVQAAIIEAFAEVEKNKAEVDEMKIWLLKQKQTQRWDSPMATVNAIYALLHQGSDWLANEGSVQVKVGNTLLQPSNTEAGTGYFKETIPVTSVRPEMGKVTVTKSDKNIGWGAMYWQYYQDLDKVSGQGNALKITKKLFVEKMTSTGKTMLPIEQAKLVKGDKVITRLVITTDRNLEFVALKDLRASCFEPVNQLSGCEWKEGVCYYQTTKDASTQFFFSFLPKGTYVFEYELWTNAAGEYTSGIASVQCQYAPEFVSHTGGERIKVN